MTITLDITPEEFTRLSDRAKSEGVSPEDILRRLIAQIPPAAPASAAPRDFAAALSALRGEPQTDDPEEVAERERENAEMQNNIARWRAEQGM